ncbi:MAG: hypothetical protein CSA62_03700 [Planctomycetota bacterium]|nr:MAG: hypothetical protein CSA62_03700 [Planctomycetota bacterium]
MGDGRDERGAAVRKRLVEAAIASFSERGFEGASTRLIAERAEANQALISYHFAGKEGLYRAAMRHIGERLREKMRPAYEAAQADLSRFEASAEVPQALVEEIVEHISSIVLAFLDFMVDEETASWAGMVVREQQQPTESFDELYENGISAMVQLLARLIWVAERGRRSRQDCLLQTVSILSMVLTFRVSRETILRDLGWKDIHTQQLHRIQDHLRRNIRILLGAENPDES